MIDPVIHRHKKMTKDSTPKRSSYNARRMLPLSLAAAMIIFGTARLYPVPDTITLPRLGHRKPAIVFSHRAHNESYGARCIDCHHTGKNVKCSGCHLNKDRGKVPNLRDAFHQRCHNCHRKTSGPMACGRCHRTSAR